jgi:hypothetical protein
MQNDLLTVEEANTDLAAQSMLRRMSEGFFPTITVGDSTTRYTDISGIDAELPGVPRYQK